jgi:hypothetical protein
MQSDLLLGDQMYSLEIPHSENAEYYTTYPSMVTGTKHPRPIFSMVTGTSPGYLPLLFSYNVYLGCVVLLRVHLKISTYKHAFFLFLHF